MMEEGGLQKLTTTSMNWQEKSSDIKETYELIRDLNREGIKMSVSSGYIFDPPKIAKFLAFSLQLQKDDVDQLTQNIKARFFEGRLEDTLTDAKKLAKMIKGEPRLGDFLEKDFIKLLVNFLGNQQNKGLQFHAATMIMHIVACSTNRKVVKQYITPSVILDFVCSKDPELQVQAMLLLQNIVLGIPDYLEIGNLIEKALDPVLSFLSYGASPKMIHIGTATLASFCQVYPNLTHEKFELVIFAVRKLIQYDSEQDLAEDILPCACSALAYLCDGRKAMVVQDAFFGEVIDRLIVLIDSDSRLNANGGLVALGSIVRWASDNHIQVMIEKDVLWSLECLIREDHKYSVIYGCWILSNITARKQKFLKDVIRCECIETLVSVVQNFKFIDGRKEAAWAILNAICGASDEHIEFLRNCCAKALWNFPTEFSDSSDIVRTCTRALVILDELKGCCKNQLRYKRTRSCS